MSRTTAIANQAGSAGKTTTAVTIAALLAAEHGRRVRLIDSDGQANATTALGVEVGGGPSLSEVLLGTASIADAEYPTKIEGLTLVPATSALDAAAVEVARAVGGEQRLRRALANASDVDNTLIDCPGALSVLTIGALVVADNSVTVTKPTIKELAGVPALEETIEDVRAAYNEALKLAAIVPCEVPAKGAGKVYEQALELLCTAYGDLVTPPVRRSARVPEAYSFGAPLHVHAPKEPVTEDYRAVVEHLLRHGVMA